MKLPSVPPKVVVAAISIAVGWGATTAVANARLTRTEEHAADMKKKVEALEGKDRENDLWKRDMVHELKDVNRALRRIERKLGSEP
jgi:hypothetical protein